MISRELSLALRALRTTRTHLSRARLEPRSVDLDCAALAQLVILAAEERRLCQTLARAIEFDHKRRVARKKQAA